MNKVTYKIFSFIIGILGGVVSIMLVIMLESVIVSISPTFLYPKVFPLYFSILILPALVEEVVKIGVARRLMEKFNSWSVILGIGLGFGFVEAAIAQGRINPEILRSVLLYAHLLFLGLGYWLAQFFTVKNRRISLLGWIVASVALHWGYDVLVVIFSK